METTETMNLESALRVLADPIWTDGEIHDFCGCLVPSDCMPPYGEEPTKKNIASDFLEWEMNVTHYSRKWKERGKSVIITLGRGEAFGAAEKVEFVASFDVTVSAEQTT